MISNWSADTDGQARAAAARRGLDAGHLQDYTVTTSGGWGQIQCHIPR